MQGSHLPAIPLDVIIEENRVMIIERRSWVASLYLHPALRSFSMEKLTIDWPPLRDDTDAAAQLRDITAEGKMR